ncbi:MAG: hypothetical protein WA268_18615 [Xanthobacteraceae bacterium]
MRLLFAAVLLAVSATAAFAQREPQIVVPGKPGVPVYINGIDASWGIVEGEFGLDRPNQVSPTVIWRPALIPAPYGVPGYYPADGRRPGYGRLEITPPANRRLPPPAPSFYRYWSSESAPTPATDPQSIQSMPMIVEPNVNVGRQRGGGNYPGGNPKPR